MLARVLPVSRSGLVPLVSEQLCTCHSFASRSLFASIHPSKILVYLFHGEFLELSGLPWDNCNPNLLRFSLAFQYLRHALHSQQKGFVHREVVPILRFKNLVCSVTASSYSPSPIGEEGSTGVRPEYSAAFLVNSSAEHGDAEAPYS